MQIRRNEHHRHEKNKPKVDKMADLLARDLSNINHVLLKGILLGLKQLNGKDHLTMLHRQEAEDHLYTNGCTRDSRDQTMANMDETERWRKDMEQSYTGGWWETQQQNQNQYKSTEGSTHLDVVI